jgi:excisionase family DNA binding protein
MAGVQHVSANAQLRRFSDRLSVSEAAERAGVSARTVKRWIAAKALPAIRLPSLKGKGHLRIRLSDLESFLARGTIQ